MYGRQRTDISIQVANSRPNIATVRLRRIVMDEGRDNILRKDMPWNFFRIRIVMQNPLCYQIAAQRIVSDLKNRLGNILIAYTRSGKPVFAGPTEATAIGNLTAQMLAAGEFASLAEARDCIAASFPLKRGE